MVVDISQVVQQPLRYAIVDEVDNILIDEARTPLIIGLPTRPASEEEAVVYVWANRLAVEMARDRHFTLDEKKQKVELTDEGREVARYSNPPAGPRDSSLSW